MSVLPNKNIFNLDNSGAVSHLIVNNLTIPGITTGELLYSTDTSGDIGGLPIGPSGYILNSNGSVPYWNNGINLNTGTVSLNSGSYLFLNNSYMQLNATSSILGQSGSVINGDTIQSNTFQFNYFPTKTGIIKTLNNIFTVDTETVTDYAAGNFSLPTTTTQLTSFSLYLSSGRSYIVTTSFQHLSGGNSSSFNLNIGSSTNVISMTVSAINGYQTPMVVYQNTGGSGYVTVAFFGSASSSGTNIQNLQFIVSPI